MIQRSNRKEMDYYLDLHYPVTVHEDSEGGFVIEIEELPGCMTQADTFDEAFEAIEDARKVWIETAYHEGHDIPLPRDMEKYQGRFLVRLPRTLHRNLVRNAKREGVSLNQYVTSLLSAGVSYGISGSEVNAMFLTGRIEVGSTLAIFGTAEEAIDYDKFISVSPVVLTGKK